MSATPKRFRIAFSFAGEKRDFIRKVARILADRFGEAAILYDKFHEAEFARRDLGIYLPNLYHKESDLVVIVVPSSYDAKQWTGLEWTAIHDLLSHRKTNEVMLCRFDRATVTGLYSTAGFVELDDKTPEQFATLILERLALNEGKHKHDYVRPSRPSRDLVYLSYSHKDTNWHRKLRRILEADPDIHPLLWDDTMLPAATEFKKEFADHLARARIIVMLVSEDYIRPNSGAAFFEMFPSLEMRSRGEGLTILWVPVRPHSYRDSPLGEITAATGVGAVALASLSPYKQTKELERVRQEIRRCLGLPLPTRKRTKPTVTKPMDPSASATVVRAEPPLPPPDRNVSTMRKTIVELDLKGYSDIARALEEHFSADLVMRFNEQIQSFVTESLKAANTPETAIMATTGDGAILAFDNPTVAHVFAEHLHKAVRLHNHDKTLPAAKRWFRIGIATGDLALEEVNGVRKMAGSVIARAVRLEAAGQIGEILVDADTYAGLPPAQRACYGAEEQIAGKRDEKFPARRYTVIAGLIASPSASVPIATRAKSSPAIERWKQKLEFLDKELPVVSSPALKFEIQCQIEEARQKIVELGG